MELDAGAQVKVAQLDRSELVAVDTKHVLRLQVPVGDPLRVEKLECGGNVSDNPSCLLLGEKLPGKKYCLFLTFDFIKSDLRWMWSSS